jgi:hypothetical protein
MHRRRRGPLAFWLLIAAILLATYALIHWLAPASDDPAATHVPVSARAHAAVSAGAHRVDFAAHGELVSLDHLEAAF